MVASVYPLDRADVVAARHINIILRIKHVPQQLHLRPSKAVSSFTAASHSFEVSVSLTYQFTSPMHAHTLVPFLRRILSACVDYCQVRVYSGKGSGQVRTKADKGQGQGAGQGVSPAGVGDRLDSNN